MDYILQLAEYKQKNSKAYVQKYEKLKDIILSTIKKEQAILYNPSDIYTFQDEKDKFIIYALRPLRVANAVTNSIFEVYSKYVTMSTKLVDKEFNINIDNENLIDVILFVPIEKQDYYKLANPIQKAIMFKKLYTILNYYTIENEDREHILKKCIKDIAIGGKKSNVVNKQIKTQLFALKVTILQEVYNRIKADAFINGNIALLSYIESIINNTPLDFNVTMNIVLLSETIYPVLIQVFKDILEQYTNYTLKIKKHDNFYIPNDFRLTKTIIYAQTDDKKMDKIYLCNVFNSGTYEILPIIKKYEVLIPSKLVLLKFLYIDLFFINQHMHYRKALMDQISFVINMLNDQNGIIIWKGVYKDEGNDKINVNLNCKKDLTIYRPWEYFSIHHKLRVL